MIRKTATLAVLEAWQVPQGAAGLQKLAHRVDFEYSPRPGFLYVRSRAISSRANDNHDEFPPEEIEKSYHSFLGKPVFVNHHNANHRRARGVIVAVALHRDKHPDGKPDTWAEVLMEVDAVRFPKLCKAILAGRVNRTSMGVDVEESQCTACLNKATDPAQYCQHLPAMKGRTLRKRDQKTGRVHESVIREICRGLSFFENSLLVEEPADPTAYVLGTPDARGMKMAASRKTAADLSGPHPGRMADRVNGCRLSCTYGGTHCAVCHQPVAVNLHRSEFNGGWHHGDGMKRDHPATPADPEGVIASIPGQQARRDQAREKVRETMQRQFESLGPTPPGRRAYEDQMPQDPFLASLRRTADTMDETPGEGRENPMSAILHHLNEAHGAPEGGALLGAQEIFKRKHGRPMHGGYGVKPSQEAPASEKNRYMTDQARTYVDAHEALHLLHQHMHGHDDEPGQSEHTWKYPDEGGEWTNSGGETRGFSHRHTLRDPLVSHDNRIGTSDEERKWLDPTSDVHFRPSDSRVINPRGFGEQGIPDHYKTREKNYPRFHPERTDKLPNVEEHQDPKDPDSWTNMSACSRTYTREQQDRSHRAGQGEPDYRSYEDKSQYSRDFSSWRDKARKRGAFCPECGAHKWLHAYHKPSEVGKPTQEWQNMGREDWDRNIRGKTGPFVPELPHYSRLMTRTAITGEEAEPGHEIWAVPHGTSPVVSEFHHNAETREPSDDPNSSGTENWYKGVSYHGPYHVVRHPETRETHVLDAQGRDAGWRGSYGNHEKQGWYGREAAEKHWQGLESEGPDAGRRTNKDGYANYDLMKERTPAFPHSRIDPEDMSRAERQDARVHKPEGFSPDDEWHGPYEVVKHPDTGKYHVVDNAGRHTSVGDAIHGHKTQMQAERSRDYTDKRQQSKERGAQIARQLFEGFNEIVDPGGTEESRQSDKNLRNGEDLMTRYAGGRGKIKFDPDDEGGAPYYHRDHYLPNGRKSGWYAKHYGGAHAEIYHHATGDTAHEMIRFPEHPDEREHPYELHPDFDDIHFGKALKEWHDEDHGARRYYEHDKHGVQNEPRISRWKQRYPEGQMEPPSHPGGFESRGSLQAEAVQYARPEDHPFFQQNPVDHAHIIRTFHEATDNEKAQGMRWYSDAHHVARMLAHGTGHTVATAAGVLSAYSPRTLWPVNLFNASRALMEPHNPPAPGTGAMGMHSNPAKRILAGEHHSEVFSPDSAPKTRAFAHLIEHGGDSPADDAAGNHHVAVDRHALSVATGHRLTPADGDAPIDKHRFYEHVAEKYRHAAKDLSEATGMDIKPHQVQAITWLVQIRKNNAEDEASATAAAKGRRKRQQNSTEQWRQHHQEFHPHMTEPGNEPNMHLSRMQRVAYGETKVPEHVNTLRQEECPVCGESQVWTGQRCPVCGYVAPPDLFRDPDTSKAMQVREELDQDGEAEIPPEGQGSWPAADDQMYHPDQLAPNGVPGVDPSQQGDETQLEGQEEPVLVCNVSGAEFGPEDGFAEGDPCPEDDGGVLEPGEPEEEDPEQAVEDQAGEVEAEGEGQLPLGNDAGGPDDPEEAEAVEEAELEQDEEQDEEDEEAEGGPPVRKRK